MIAKNALASAVMQMHEIAQPHFEKDQALPCGAITTYTAPQSTQLCVQQTQYSGSP